VTYRCNSRCETCDLWRHPGMELSPNESLALVDQIAEAGVRSLGLTGGEPLLREDLEPIVARAAQRGMGVRLNTNGWLLPERPALLTACREAEASVSISIEGPRHVHDAVRGPGAFDRAVAGAAVVRERGLRLIFAATLGRANISQVAELPRLAAEHGAQLLVQPVRPLALGSTRAHAVVPSPEEMRGAIAYLRGLPRGSLANSAASLAHFAAWPRSARPLACAGGRIVGRVEPDGDVYHCGDVHIERPRRNVLDVGLLPALESLPPVACRDCFCAGRVDANLLFGGDVSAALGLAGRA
jgi:MoaA/NifB/PqqE/SkfB family radical SAM enzyme